MTLHVYTWTPSKESTSNYEEVQYISRGVEGPLRIGHLCASFHLLG